jgi:hypothetical protein
MGILYRLKKAAVDRSAPVRLVLSPVRARKHRRRKFRYRVSHFPLDSGKCLG